MHFGDSLQAVGHATWEWVRFVEFHLPLITSVVIPWAALVRGDSGAGRRGSVLRWWSWDLCFTNQCTGAFYVEFMVFLRALKSTLVRPTINGGVPGRCQRCQVSERPDVQDWIPAFAGMRSPFDCEAVSQLIYSWPADVLVCRLTYYSGADQEVCRRQQDIFRYVCIRSLWDSLGRSAARWSNYL